MSSEDRLKKFLARATQPSAKNTRLSLYQVIANGGESLLRHHELSSEYGYGEEKLALLLSEFWEIAQDDADGHLGTTAYVVVAYQGVKMGERSSVFRLRSQATGDGGSIISETEPATAQGQQAQLMRHLEAKDRTLMVMVELMSRQSADVIGRLTAQSEHYEKRHWDNIELAEKMQMERDTAALNKSKQLAFDKRMDETLKMLKPLVPLVLSKIKGLTPAQKAGAQTDVIGAIMSTITPEQMEKIAEILGPQALPLAELYIDSRKGDFSNGESESGEASKH